jgi:hypothetical protein
MHIIEAQDAFLKHMFARMSPGAEALFSARQLDEIRRAFGARSNGHHWIEWRAGLRLFRKSYYLVFLIGREHRSKARLGLTIPGLSLKVLIIALLAFFVVGLCV